MKKLISLLAVFLSLNVQAIAVDWDCPGTLVDGAELMSIINKNLASKFNNYRGDKYRLSAHVSTAIFTDSTVNYYSRIALQKRVIEQKTGKEYWVETDYRLSYGNIFTKQGLVDTITAQIVDNVNTWEMPK